MSDLTTHYEQEIARQTGVDQAIAFGFARHALVAALSAAGLGAGDEVILSPLTCKVVPLALLSGGFKPVYTDICATSLNLDPVKLQAQISARTRAVLFQHTYGHMNGIRDTLEITTRNRIFLLEDCAQCLPLHAAGYAPGHFGACAIFSNNPGKPLPAGSGGIALTRDIDLAGKISTVRDNLPQRGYIDETKLFVEELLHRYLLRPSLYWILFDAKRRTDKNYLKRPQEEEILSEISETAYRPSTRQMQIGARWLRRTSDIARHRTACCIAYNNGLANDSRITQPLGQISEPLYYYPVLVNNKADLLQCARKKRVEIIPWPIKTPIYPVEDKSLLMTYDYNPGSCPVADSVAERIIGLPTHKKVTSAVQNKIIRFLKQHSGTG